MPSSHLILCCPLLLLPTIPPSIRVFSNESTLQMKLPKDWSFSFSICPSNEHPELISLRMDYGSPCSPRDSQESSPTPQFKSINFLVLSFLHSPTLTSIHDHWKNHSLDQTDLCWQSNVSNFPTCQTQKQTQTDEVTGLSRRPRIQISFFFPSKLTIYLKKKLFFNFLAVPHSLWNLSSPTSD